MSSNNIDFRARLYPKGIYPWPDVFGDPTGQDQNNILYPLILVGGLVFPYTPTISFGGTAMYDEYHFTHTNYAYQAWQKSKPNDIQISAPFTAQTAEEARYMLAVIHFLSSATKGIFGEKSATVAGSPQAPNTATTTNQTTQTSQSLSGSPPPILYFDYLGNSMFKQVPVVIKSYTFNLPNDVDYVNALVGSPTSTNSFGNNDKSNYVPTRMDINIVLTVQYNTTSLRQNFSLSNFIKGNYLNTNGGGFV